VAGVKRGAYKYNFDKILPEICDEYINSEKSIVKILVDRGGPDFSHFYKELRKNPDYQEMWIDAERGKAAVLDADFDEIRDLAREAFRNKDLNVNALKILHDHVKTRRGQLDAKYRDREVKHVVEAGKSWRQVMTEGRMRLAKGKIIEGEVIKGD